MEFDNLLLQANRILINLNKIFGDIYDGDDKPSKLTAFGFILQPVIFLILFIYLIY